MAEKIRVAVIGACGKMGQEVVKAVAGAADMTLVGACDVGGRAGWRLASVVAGGQGHHSVGRSPSRSAL